jgi:hypothetical protein
MSMPTEEKMVLTAADAAALEGAHTRAVSELLDAEVPKANVVGAALGVKWKDGEPTGEPAVVVLVSHKAAKEELRKEDLIPAKIGEVKTDVLEIGFPIAEQLRTPQQVRPEEPGNGVMPSLEEEQYAALAGALMLARRTRPAKGGYSVGHYHITAGTIATCVYDILPGGTTSPPVLGLGTPPRYYVLSNNHVLANTNNANIGDPILQPGPYDGGTDPADRIATLSRWIPITLEPPTPRFLHRNLVDAAIAQGQFHDLDREIYWTGCVRGWRRKTNVAVGTLVQKTGRTTNFTTGRITAINATVDVGYGGGRVGRFFDQIILTNMSAGGDSGSLITTLDEVAVGLLFAGSAVATIANQIENVRSLLRVEVAEQVL